MDAPSSSRGSKPALNQVLAKRATYQEEDSNERSEPLPCRSQSVDSSSSNRFACHFLLANPRKVQANAICARHTWPSIPRLKEHLYRRHAHQRFSCPRCATAFEKEKDFDEHLRAEQPCKIVDSSDRPSQSISPAQMYKLRRRKGQYNETDVHKWFEIWELLFPDTPRPKSPYLEAQDRINGWGLPMLDDLQVFVERRVSTTVLESLQKGQLINKGRPRDQENIKAFISSCVSSAFEEYKTDSGPRKRRITDAEEELAGSWETQEHDDGALVKTPNTQRSTTLSSGVSVTTSSTCCEDLELNAKFGYGHWSYSTDSPCLRSPESTATTLDVHRTSANTGLQEPMEYLESQHLQGDLWASSDPGLWQHSLDVYGVGSYDAFDEIASGGFPDFDSSHDQT